MTEPVIFLQTPIFVKLTQGNYLAWHSQVLPFLEGYGLEHFLTQSPPIQHLSGPSDAQPQLNPAYTAWKRQDKFILGWLRSSLSDPVLAQIVSSTSSAELWGKLQQIHTANSLTRITELRNKFQNIKKGGSSCAECLQFIRLLAGELSFIGSPVPDSELVLKILGGLGTDYNPLVMAL